MVSDTALLAPTPGDDAWGGRQDHLLVPVGMGTYNSELLCSLVLQYRYEPITTYHKLRFFCPRGEIPLGGEEQGYPRTPFAGQKSFTTYPWKGGTLSSSAPAQEIMHVRSHPSGKKAGCLTGPPRPKSGAFERNGGLPRTSIMQIHAPQKEARRFKPRVALFLTRSPLRCTGPLPQARWFWT